MISFVKYFSLVAFRATDCRKHCCNPVNIKLFLGFQKTFCKVTLKIGRVWNAIICQFISMVLSSFFKHK